LLLSNEQTRITIEITARFILATNLFLADMLLWLIGLNVHSLEYIFDGTGACLELVYHANVLVLGPPGVSKACVTQSSYPTDQLHWAGTGAGGCGKTRLAFDGF
jgi:hypothetical protein